MSDAPERISLELRQGLSDDFWSECRDPRYAKSEPVAYVRADRLEAQEALLKEAMGALDDRDGGSHDADCKSFRSWPPNHCNCGHERARATLAKLRSHMGDNHAK